MGEGQVINVRRCFGSQRSDVERLYLVCLKPSQSVTKMVLRVFWSLCFLIFFPSQIPPTYFCLNYCN